MVAALRGSQLPGYQESVTEGTRTLYRVRIGPFATQADAEAARLRAGHVRDDVGAKVLVLNAEPATAAPADATASPAQQPSAQQQAASTSKATQAPSKPVVTTTAAAPPPSPVKPAATTPPPAKTQPARPASTQTAAANTGFAVQLRAFSNQTEATKLRDRARAAGLRAFVESVRTDQGLLHRVRVGPVLTRPEADQLKAQVMTKLGIADAIVAAFAIMQGMDGRLKNFSAPDKRCALLPLCRGCVKYDQRSCKVRTLFQWAILALAILAFIPLAASPAMNSYVTTIFGTPYNYCRLLFNQYFESRYLPLVTLFLCAAAMVVMRLDGKKQMPILARILFAGAAGALGFGIFRLMLGAIFSDALIWADFWEEVTELMFVGFMAVGLWVYREGVLDVPLSKGLFR